ncbi:hypothetical protein [Gallaecimonas pentaromativorans]|uniref:hypothetical protein n=1 Tax=Gallaecimonas pentaromativorans TaxID=584787 RepID=UPI003A94C6E0
MSQLYLNNCHAVLDAAVSPVSTTLVLTEMHGFPLSLAEDEWFTLTIFVDSSRYGSNLEVVKVTAISGNEVTVERGHEGAALGHNAGEIVESRLTADAMAGLQRLAEIPSWEAGDIRYSVGVFDTPWHPSRGDYAIRNGLQIADMLAQPLGATVQDITPAPSVGRTANSAASNGEIVMVTPRVSGGQLLVLDLRDMSHSQVTFPYDAGDNYRSARLYATDAGDFFYGSTHDMLFTRDGLDIDYVDFPAMPTSDPYSVVYGEGVIFVSYGESSSATDAPRVSLDRGETWIDCTFDFSQAADPTILGEFDQPIVKAGGYYITVAGKSRDERVLRSLDAVHWEVVTEQYGYCRAVVAFGDSAVFEFGGNAFMYTPATGAFIQLSDTYVEPPCVEHGGRLWMLCSGRTYALAISADGTVEEIPFTDAERMNPECAVSTPRGIVAVGRYSEILLFSAYPKYVATADAPRITPVLYSANVVDSLGHEVPPSPVYDTVIAGRDGAIAFPNGDSFGTYKVAHTSGDARDWEVSPEQTPYDITSAVYHRATDTLYATTSDDGLVRSLDGGYTWVEVPGLTESGVRGGTLHIAGDRMFYYPTDSTVAYTAKSDGVWVALPEVMVSDAPLVISGIAMRTSDVGPQGLITYEGHYVSTTDFVTVSAPVAVPPVEGSTREYTEVAGIRDLWAIHQPYAGAMMTSADGITWAEVSVSTQVDSTRPVLWSFEGALILSTDAYNAVRKVARSTDGENWTDMTGLIPNVLRHPPFRLPYTNAIFGGATITYDSAPYYDPIAALRLPELSDVGFLNMGGEFEIGRIETANSGGDF